MGFFIQKYNLATCLLGMTAWKIKQHTLLAYLIRLSAFLTGHKLTETLLCLECIIAGSIYETIKHIRLNTHITPLVVSLQSRDAAPHCLYSIRSRIIASSVVIAAQRKKLHFMIFINYTENDIITEQVSWSPSAGKRAGSAEISSTPRRTGPTPNNDDPIHEGFFCFPSQLYTFNIERFDCDSFVVHRVYNQKRIDNG